MSARIGALVKTSIVSAVFLFGLAAWLLAGEPAQSPAVRLALIPPSPVTDQITLELRGAVQNTGGTPRVFEASFQIQQQGKTETLYTEKIEVPAGDVRGVRFRWPTKGRAGQATIALAVRSGGNEVARECRPLKIIPSTQRSTGRLGGAWAGIVHWSEVEGRPWNAQIKQMTEDQWRQLVRGMHAIDMDIIVVEEVFRLGLVAEDPATNCIVGNHHFERDGYPGMAFYPSKLSAKRIPIAAKDPIEAILSEADRLGMSVFLGVGTYAWRDYTPGSLVWHKKVADELWQMYGHHRGFYGWYISEECNGNLAGDDRIELRRKEIVDFFRDFTPHVRRYAPEKPVLLAPNCYGLRGAEPTYRKLLPNLDILCPFCFHRTLPGDLRGEEAANLLQQLCDESGSHLWMDMESFVFPQGLLIPRPISGIATDLRRFTNFEKVICFQYPGILTAPDANPRLGGDAAVKLYNDYKHFLAHGLPIQVSHLAIGKPVRLATQYTTEYPYTGGGAQGLTDGQIGLEDYQDPHWQGYHGNDLDATVDLGRITALTEVSSRYLQFTAGGIFFPTSVEYAMSEDGKEFRTLATVVDKVTIPEPGPLTREFKAAVPGVKARYLRVRAKNRGLDPNLGPQKVKAWLFVDEIIAR
jgi:hypothetical protein